jgi:hypothetical protein
MQPKPMIPGTVPEPLGGRLVQVESTHGLMLCRMERDRLSYAATPEVKAGVLAGLDPELGCR